MKMKIAGDAYVIESKIKLADLEILEKHNPSATILKDEEGKNDVFTIIFREGKPSIQPFAVAFSGVTRDDNQYLTLTGALKVGLGEKEAKEYIADAIAPVMGYLKKLEETIPEEANKVRGERKSLVDSITVA